MNISTEPIDHIISQLEIIKQDCKKNQDPLGYFATLYQIVTKRVKQGIIDGEFEDNERMQDLDVIFANRYLDAYKAYQNGEKCSESWKIAFDAGKNYWPIVLQHLVLGMNAHISLDLGIAAAQTRPNQPIEELEGDFTKINEILAELLEVVKKRLYGVWHPFQWIDKLTKKLNTFVGNFSIKIARVAAWEVALKVSAVKGEDRKNYIAQRDNKVAGYANLLVNVGGIVAVVLGVIRLTEAGNVTKRIEALEGDLETYLNDKK